MLIEGIKSTVDSLVQAFGLKLITREGFSALCDELSTLAEGNQTLAKKNQELQEKCDRREVELAVRTGPSIMFNTMPKSGSVYIAQWLAKLLSLTPKQISPGYFPHDVIDYPKIKEFAQGGAIAQEHLEPSPMNKQLLAAFVDKMVVHVRDPRQATISWTHHLNWLYDQGHGDFLFATVFPRLPDAYFASSLDWQINYQLSAHLPLLVSWCESWLETSRTWTGVEILCTSYEDFLRNGEQFINNILAFFEVDVVQPMDGPPPRTRELHFRKGVPDEWRTILAPSQQTKVNEMIPDSLANHFGWKRE
ncbi:MAG: sulfotransferase domain-containing protein [Thermodesulfobacteriota bacterium]